MELDDKDRKILNTLIENGRLSYREIAKKLKISTATVMHRVDALKASGAVKRYTTELDYEALGLDIQIIVDIRVSKGKLKEVENKIAKNPNVSAVYDTTGRFDITAIARFRNRRSMDGFLKKLQSFDFVERTETRFVLNTVKEGAIQI